MKVCPKCNQQHDRNGIFCSRKCSNSRVWSEEDKIKKSVANVGKPSWAKGKILGPTAPNSKRRESAKMSADKLSLSRFESGQMTERNSLRKHLIRLYGDCCSVCKITEWQGNKITFQVDHINGYSNDNSPHNLRLICPNCHSQTPTYGARNKGKGRKALGVKTN